MANNQRKQSTNIQRVNLDNVKPLEVWDCQVGDGILWDFMYTSSFPGLLLSVTKQIYLGTAVTAFGEPVSSDAIGFDSIYLCGGGAQSIDIVNELRRLDVPLVVAKDPVFSSVQSGKQLLASFSLSGIAVDVGQTQIKVFSDGSKATFQRNFDDLPIRPLDGNLPNTTQDHKFCQFVSNAIKLSIDQNSLPEAMLLALPCTITSTCGLGECSYESIGSNSNLVQEIAESSFLTRSDIFLINDAELAGYSAGLDKRLDKYKRTLVLTLGFGVGASLLDRSCH